MIHDVSRLDFKLQRMTYRLQRITYKLQKFTQLTSSTIFPLQFPSFQNIQMDSDWPCQFEDENFGLLRHDSVIFCSLQVIFCSLQVTPRPINLIYHLLFIIQNHFRACRIQIQNILVNLKETTNFFQYIQVIFRSLQVILCSVQSNIPTSCIICLHNSNCFGTFKWIRSILVIERK